MASKFQSHRILIGVATVAISVAVVRWRRRKARQRAANGQPPPSLNRVKEVLLDDLWFAEGPRWHDGCLYFSDFGPPGAEAINAVNWSTKERRTVVRILDAEENFRGPSGFGWKPDGTLLVSQMRTRKLLAFPHEQAAEPVQSSDLSKFATGHCNDIVVASDGSAYVGNFGFDLALVEGKPPNEYQPFLQRTCLIHVNSDGVVSKATPKELLFPNGMVITPDGGTLLVAETFGQRISAYKRAADGSLSERRTWATIPFTWPDGMCLDTEGALWVALAGGGHFIRLAEHGIVLEVIPATLGFKAIACVLGGEDGCVLFMLEAKESAEDLIKKNGSGNSRITTAHVDTPAASMPNAPHYAAGYC